MLRRISIAGIAGMLLFAPASAMCQNPVSEKVTKADTLKEWGGAGAIDLSFGGGTSDKLAETYPPAPGETFQLGDKTIGYRVRLRAHYSAFGLMLLFARHQAAEEHDGWFHSANSAQLFIALSHHVSLFDHRFRLESLAGFAHARDAVEIRKVVYSGYAYRYHEVFSKVGAGAGADVVVWPLSRVALHGMFVHTTPPIKDDHLAVEALISLRRTYDLEPGYKPGVWDLSLIIGHSMTWKKDKREDTLYYVGLGIGNWATQ